MKKSLIIIITMALVYACQKEDLNSPLQVYEEWSDTPFIGDIDLVGVPNCSYGSFDIPGLFPSSTFVPSEYPWKIKGKVIDGKISIEFPVGKFDLPSIYNSFTEGLTMSQVFIEDENNGHRKIALHKIGDDMNGRIYILYVSGNFSNELVTFKSGWNFVEIFRNPNWFYGSEEPSELIGMITQNVNYFLGKGYRWKMERWI